MAIQAYAERLGAVELGPWIGRVPNFRDRRVLSRILAEEAHHAYMLYEELEALGVSEAEAIALAEGGGLDRGPDAASLAGPRAVAHEQNEWDDIPLNNMFLDRAGRHMVTNFAESSYEPWARISERILKDEKLHEGFGYRQLRRMVREYRDRDALAQKITRWFALGLNFFGPPASSKTERLRLLGLKRRSNEELRCEYRQEVIGLLAGLGVADLVRLQHDAFPYV